MPRIDSNGQYIKSLDHTIVLVPRQRCVLNYLLSPVADSTYIPTCIISASSAFGLHTVAFQLRNHQPQTHGESVSREEMLVSKSNEHLD